MNTNITALKEEELDNVQGGIIGCIIAYTLSAAAVIAFAVVNKSKDN